MSRFIRKRAAPNILPKKTPLNVHSKPDTRSEQNASDLKDEITKQTANDEVLNKNVNNLDTTEHVTKSLDPPVNQRCQITTTSNKPIQSNDPPVQKDLILERLSCLSSELDSQERSKNVTTNNNNPLLKISEPIDSSIGKDIEECQNGELAKDVNNASKNSSLEQPSDSNKSSLLISDTSPSADSKVDNFSLSVLDKLKKISTPVIPKKRPVPNINKVITKSTDNTVKNLTLPSIAFNQNSSSLKPKYEINELIESSNVNNTINNLNSIVNNDDLVVENSGNVVKKLVENEVKPIRAPLGRRAMPILPRKRPAPCLKPTNGKNDDPVENDQSKSLVEPPLKLAKKAQENLVVLSNADTSPKKEGDVAGNLQANFTESEHCKNTQVKLGNNNLENLAITAASVRSEVSNDNSVKVETVESNLIKPNNGNKYIKKRVGPNLAQNNVKKTEKQILVTHDIKIDNIPVGLSEIDKAENVTPANKNMKLLVSKSTEETHEVNATVSALPSTSKVKSKGVLRVYLNCWPSYPLCEVMDSLHSGAPVEDVGKVSIFSNKKHKIAYWDLKRVVDFENTPKNWVNINFNKLIKEEFKEPDEEINEEVSSQDQINYYENQASENEEYERESCEPNTEHIEVSSSTLSNKYTAKVTDPKFNVEIDQENNLASVLSLDSPQDEVPVSNGSSSEVLKLDGSEQRDISEAIKSNKPTDTIMEAKNNSEDEINLKLKPEESSFVKIISEVAAGNLGITTYPEKNESSGRRKKSKTPKKIVECHDSTDNNKGGSKMNENKKPKKRKTTNRTDKEKPKKLKFDKRLKEKYKNEKVTEELADLASELNQDQPKESYKFRPKKPLKNVENYEDEDLDKPEDIFSNSEFSDSEYECELENKINRNKLKVKMNSVIKQKKPRKPKEKIPKEKKPEQTKPKIKKDESEKNIAKKVKKTPKVNERSSDFKKLGNEVMNKNKWDQEGNCAEPEKLELKDFIFYTPKSEPMSQDFKKEINVDPDEDIIADEKREEEENTGPKLIVKDGKIMVDPNSTKIKQTPIIQPKIEKVEKPKDINDPWELKETMKFYASLWKYGIDYSILAGTFPKKSRESIKRKYNYEQKNNGTLLTKTLTKKLDIKAVLREIILIDCLDKLSNKRNKEKIKKEPKETKVKKKGKHCLIQRPSKKPKVDPPSPVRLIDFENDSQLSMNSYLSDNEIIISDDVRHLNMEDIITFSTNLVYKDMNIVESVSFHPSAINPIDINVTIKHDTDETTPQANDETSVS